MPDRAVYAARALRAYGAMQTRFRRRDGLYRCDRLPRRLWAPAHLWPFSRALVATLDMAGLPAQLVPEFDSDAAIARERGALERYWDQAGGAYSSDVVGSRMLGNHYYDDNAWVGLALVQLERLRPGSGSLERARQLFRFAVGGWDRRSDVPWPGGVFWVEQGRGAGRRNHDRNTVSNAPNAQLGLHVAELGAGATTEQGAGAIGPEQMYGWVNSTLDAGGAGTGLFWDKVRGDGTVDRALWSYNQGSMLGANVLLARRAAGAERARRLAPAEAIARRALRHYDGRWERQPADFNAILFRNLLLLHDATGDRGLRDQIVATMRAYADRAWSEHRSRRDLFSPAGREAEVTLRHQSAIVQVLALLGWDPGDYGKLA